MPARWFPLQHDKTSMKLMPEFRRLASFMAEHREGAFNFVAVDVEHAAAIKQYAKGTLPPH